MLSSHDHGNCELCDHIERRLAQVQKELSDERMWREHYQTMANVASKNNAKLRDQLAQARQPAQPPLDPIVEHKHFIGEDYAQPPGQEE